ncbi:early nodulin-93-like [Oryza glaberrima]|nr:early nodulin-93-like [Oryza glaberrima]
MTSAPPDLAPPPPPHPDFLFSSHPIIVLIAMATVTRAHLEQRLALAKRCSREANIAGVKAAAVATIASAVPTLASVRMVPWAKANINPTGQALIICTAAGMAYFVAADKKILSLARRHSFENAPEHLKNTSFQGTGRPHPAFFRP